MVAIKNEGGKPDESREVPARVVEEDVIAHVKSKEEGGFVAYSQEMWQTLRRLFNLCESHFAALCDTRVILPTTGCPHPPAPRLGVLWLQRMETQLQLSYS